jgi:phospholipid-binding lipoprotein MlaA
MLPLLGPSSVRDTAALPLDRSASPALAFKDDADRIGLTTLNLVDSRARLLDASRLLDEIALDRYSFLRDAYLARRRSLVYDGEPPEEPEADDEPGEPVSGSPR